MRRRPSVHTARSVRVRSTPVTGTARSVPAASSAATASELSTIGLAARSHADVLRAGSVVLFALLL